MPDRPICSRCTKPIANDARSCGDDQCYNIFHPRCSSLYARTASASACCKIAFPLSVAANRTLNRKKQSTVQSRTTRAQYFDRDRDVVFDPNQPSTSRGDAQSFNSILPFSQSQTASFRQSQPHSMQPSFSSYPSNSVQSLDPAHTYICKSLCLHQPASN